MLERFLDWEKVGGLKYDNKWKAEILTTDQFGEKVIFCAPQTYMNLSGESV
jgi:peptidyl-tRNA hydrolase